MSRFLPEPSDAEVALLKRDLYHNAGGDLLPTPGGDVTTVAGAVNLREAIYRRLLASPGDLPWDPSYGIGLRAEVNENVTDSVKQRWITRIRTQLSTDPRIREVREVTVTPDATGEPTVQITITYQDATGGEHVDTFPVRK